MKRRSLLAVKVATNFSGTYLMVIQSGKLWTSFKITPIKQKKMSRILTLTLASRMIFAKEFGKMTLMEVSSMTAIGMYLGPIVRTVVKFFFV